MIEPLSVRLRREQDTAGPRRDYTRADFHGWASEAAALEAKVEAAGDIEKAARGLVRNTKEALDIVASGFYDELVGLVGDET